jgi:hypothetical protein
MRWSPCFFQSKSRDLGRLSDKGCDRCRQLDDRQFATLHIRAQRSWRHRQILNRRLQAQQSSRDVVVAFRHKAPLARSLMVVTSPSVPARLVAVDRQCCPRAVDDQPRTATPVFAKPGYDLSEAIVMLRAVADLPSADEPPEQLKERHRAVLLKNVQRRPYELCCASGFVCVHGRYLLCPAFFLLPHASGVMSVANGRSALSAKR